MERPAFIHRQVVEMMRWNALQVWRNLLEGATPIALPVALPIALPITLPILKIRYTDNRKGGGDKAGCQVWINLLHRGIFHCLPMGVDQQWNV